MTRTPQTPARPGTRPELTDVVLAAGAVLLTLAGLLWAGAATANAVTGHPVPAGGLLTALTALRDPGDPAAAWPHPPAMASPVPYWAGTTLVLLAATALIAAGWRIRTGLLLRARGGRVRDLPGLATATEADHAAGRAAVLARATVVRPSTVPAPTNPTGAVVLFEPRGDRRRRERAAAQRVGYQLGSLHRRELWYSVEDSVLILGPPRMGKGLHLVIPWVLDAPGPVITTSTRPDTLAVAHAHRSTTGPVSVFDPQHLAGLGAGLAWSPVRGCQTPRTALVRARGLAAGTGFGPTVSDANFWQGQTETALRCLLHAAALEQRRAIDLYRWSLNPALAQDAVTILTTHPDAAEGWADALETTIHADPRTRDSIWLGVRQSLAALADPAVLASVDPDPDDAFDPVAFLRGSGTLFLLASAVAAGSCAPLVAAFVEDITETARALAARSPGARLDPPLLLALDEIANLTPLPSLPMLMAEGGGSGITTVAVLQSLAQARHRWGEHAADAIWDAATVKIILGGLAKMRDLDDVSGLLGNIDEPVRTINHGRAGERSTSTALRHVPVMAPSVLRTLPFGTAVLLLRHTRPAVIDLHPWTTRPDAAKLTACRTGIETAAAATTEDPSSTAATPAAGADHLSVSSRR